METEVDECRCQKEIGIIPSDIPDRFNEIEERYLDFGKVEVGRKKWLKYYLQNEHECRNEYAITRDPDVNPLYQVFNFSTYRVTVPAKSSTILRVSYRPLYPESADVDCFHLTDSRNNVWKICTRGIGEGPSVQISTTFLRFNTWDERISCKHTVELKNDTSIAAIIHFDIDKDDAVFKVDKINFTVPPHKYIFVNITFNPKEYGVFGRKLECLILNHEPILLEVFGVHTRKNELRDYALIHCPRRGNIGSYNMYMRDVQIVMDENPLFSLTDNYLDFGGVAAMDRMGKSMVTSFTNHLQSRITVKFEEDAIFRISPNCVEIPKNDSVLFEVTFSPDRPDYQYFRNYAGTVLWQDERAFAEEFKRIEIPLSFSLKLLGHSFFDDTFWLPQLELLPEVIVLPPAVPGSSSFYTFKLRNRGYLPVAFKFLPPKKTNFIIKPMLGVVFDYQLLVAQLQADGSRKQPKVYVEQWSVMMNNRKDHVIYLYLKGFSEMPRLVIGDKNRVKFACVQTGCAERICVPIRNKCQHRLKYHFILDNVANLNITNPIGELTPNEVVHLDWYFTSNTNSCVKYTVICLVNVLQKMKLVVGAPYEMAVEVYTESAYSELCCIPDVYNFGTVQSEVCQRVDAEMHNFGPTVVHYKLETLNTGKDRSTVSLIGSVGTLYPAEKARIAIEYIPSGVGEHNISVVYKVRKSDDSPEVLENYQRLLFQINCSSLYPYFQIVDIVDHNFGQLFAKMDLWDLFNVDDLNRALKTMEKNQTCEVVASLPDKELCEEVCYAVCLMKNVTEFPVDVELKRRQLCDCKLREMTGLSVRKKQFNCPHRRIFAVHIENNIIEPEMQQTLQLDVRYVMHGVSEMSYEMTLQWDRRIILNFKFKSLSHNDRVISKYTPALNLKLKPVCLSEKNPQIQAFWFYNNMEKTIEYNLDTDEMKIRNYNYDYEVFSCLNPSGTIEGYSRRPLLFRFAPIEKKCYQVNLSLRMGNEEALFSLSGEGRKRFQGFDRIPPKIFSSLDYNVPITLSEDYIQIEPIPVWSSTARLVFIRNTSADSIIGYSWLGYEIEGIVEARLLVRKGVLYLNESHPLLIEIKSFSKPGKLRLQLGCKLLNHSEYYLHKKSVSAYNCRQEQIKDEFTITENGIEYPTNEILVYPMPKQFFTVLSIDVSITSVPDRDMQHTPAEQLAHSPRELMSCGSGMVDNKICSPLPHSSEESLFTTAIYFERKKALEAEKPPCHGGYPFKLSDHSDSVEEEITEESSYIDGADDVEMYKNTIECILADALFSPLFREIIRKRRYEAPLYYEQIRNAPQDDRLVAQAKREKLIKELYNEPPAPLIGDVIHEMIFNAVYEIFDLEEEALKLARVSEIGESN